MKFKILAYANDDDKCRCRMSYVNNDYDRCRCRCRMSYVNNDDDGRQFRMSYVDNDDDKRRCRMSYVGTAMTMTVTHEVLNFDLG